MGIGSSAEFRSRQVRILWGLAISFGLVGVMVHGVQVMAVLPRHITAPALLDFPHSFHAWLVETAAWLIAIACALSALLLPSLSQRFASATPLQKAIVLGAVLVSIQAVLALMFWLSRNHGPEDFGGLRAAFWLGGEFRIPVFFAVLQHMLAAWLTWQCFKIQRRASWAMCAALFVYLGMDELLSIHERVGTAVSHWGLLQQSGEVKTVRIGDTYFYVWVLVFLPVVALVGGWFLLQFRRLIGVGSLLMLSVAALVFLGGAMGLETRESHQRSTLDLWDYSTARHLNLLLEETMETLGVTLAVGVFAWRRWVLMNMKRDYDT